MKTNFSSYKVVCSGNASPRMKKLAEYLAGKIGAAAYSDACAAGAKEILIGDTDREESMKTAAVLASATEPTAYAIEVRESRIVIAGKDETSLILGVKYFSDTFVDEGAELPADYRRLYATANEVTVYDDFTVLEMGIPSVVYGDAAFPENGANTSYPKVIRLEHGTKGYGTLLATMEVGNYEMYPIFRSTDDGRTWQTFSEVRDATHHLMAHWQPYLYELPMQVGEMPKGTLILAGCLSKFKLPGDLLTVICLWRSFDGGKTWEPLSDVDDSYLSRGQNGLWEPVVACDGDGSLLCFYSDENDKAHYDQRLVYRKSSDGIRWGDLRDAVALSEENLRPGMISFVRMNNGKYLATYEVVRIPGGPIHYRIFDGLDNWGDVTVRGKQIETIDGKRFGTSPWVGYLPGNGACGMLIVSAEHMVTDENPKGFNMDVEWFASLDYGATWFSIPNPMPYAVPEQKKTRSGYSSCFFSADDGHTAYFIQATDGDPQVHGNCSIAKIVRLQVW